MIIEYYKKKLPDSRKNEIMESPTFRKLFNLANDVRSFGFGSNLTKLGKIFGTDKAITHNYTPHYMTHLRKFKFKRIKLFEIGVGGYDNPILGGKSLRMWKRYFPYGRVYSMDIHDKSKLQERRIKIYKGSQVDEELLNRISNEAKGFDIIIDDGSHLNEHVINTFQILFPKLNDGGIYVIEDTQTSYIEKYGGTSENMANARTSMNFFKSLADSLNHQEFQIPDYQPTYYDQKVVAIHFYHNLVFVYKGNNDEKSNLTD